MSEQLGVSRNTSRNTVLLALLLGHAEVIGAVDLFIGANAVDYSGYPDCRPEFIESFERTANLATKAGVEAAAANDPSPAFRIVAPLMDLTKAQIIARGLELGVNYALTVTCYDPSPEGVACGRCDACLLRLRGFDENGIADPAPYAEVTP